VAESKYSKAALDKATKNFTDYQTATAKYKGANKGVNDQWTARKNAMDATQKGYDYAQSLNNLDTSTVSGKIKQQYGEAGFEDKQMQDTIKGIQFGETVLGEEGLGRISQEQNDRMRGMQDQAAEMAKGYSSAENLARQEKGIEGISGSTQSQSRAAQAAMARSGVKGQAAGAQLGNIAASGVQARGNMERDLIIANRDAQMQGMQLQQGVEKDATANSQFDLSQAAKEKKMLLASGFGYAGLGATERGAKLNADAVIASANTQGGGGGGGTVICTELHRQGLLSTELYNKDKAFSEELMKARPEIYIGYFLWAQHLAKAMANSTLLTTLVKPVALAWAKQIAGEKSLLGSLIQNVGAPLCGFIGKIVIGYNKLVKA